MSKFVAALALVLLASNAYAAGYTSRACGFDVDGDGIAGEAGECDFCDGVTTDPDGDGEAEDLIYVDCNSGNNANAGTAASPKLTIAGALAASDGNADGREDIICVRATCTAANGSGVNNVTINKDGVAGIKTREADYVDRYESNDFNYPAEPAMIIGWDTDNDGEYPPYDSSQSEPAIIDATNGGSYYGRAFNLGDSDYFEMAHLTFANYGRGADGTSGEGIVNWPNSGSQNYTYFHDLVITGMTGAAGSTNPDGDNRAIFRIYFGSSTYTAIENTSVVEAGGTWTIRGAGYGPYANYLRIQNNTWTPQAGTGFMKSRIWGINNIEWIGNKFDNSALTSGQLDTADETVNNFEQHAQTIGFYVQGNEFIDVPMAVRGGWMIGANNVIPDQKSDEWYIRRNMFRLTQNPQSVFPMLDLGPGAFNGSLEYTECSQFASNPCSQAACNPASQTFGTQQDCTCQYNTFLRDVVISDNVFDFGNFADTMSAIAYQNGSGCDPSTDGTMGPLRIHNNSFLNFNPTTTNSTRGIIRIGRTTNQPADFYYVRGNVYIYNNLFEGFDTDFAIINEKRGDDDRGPQDSQSPAVKYYDSAHLFIDNNIYRGSSVKFRRGTTEYTGASALTSWRSATGGDANSDTCTPLVDTDGYSLLSTDSCARNQGNNTHCSAYDYEGDPRPDGICDIGADEYAVSSPSGECTTGADCNDNNPCTTDSCVGSPTACVNTNNTLSCNDGTYCNGSDTCSGGTCSTHAGNPCPGADGDSDCSETCNEATDSCTANDPNGSACSDGAYCTSGETCSSGSCTGGTDPCAANLGDEDSDCSESCNESTDSCTANDTNGSNCDDGLFCTEPDACASGTCTGAALDCSASDTSCKTGTCDEGTDACISGANKPDGTSCNDGTFCNGADECASGDCTTHAGDPCIGGPNPICNESLDSCSAYTDVGGGGMTCWGCSCQGCVFK